MKEIDKDILTVLLSIVSTLISTFVLVKSETANLSDRVKRGQWAFEEYLKSISDILYSDSSPSQEMISKYKTAMLFANVYLNKKLRDMISDIDNYVVAGRRVLIWTKLLDLVSEYRDEYNMEKYSPPKRWKILNKQRNKLR